jgi:hypothetical protein
MKLLFPRPLQWLLLAAVVFHAAARAAEDRDSIRAELAGAVEVQLRTGRTIRGTLVGLEGERMRLHVSGAGEAGAAILSFSPAEVERLRLAGAELELQAFESLERGELDFAVMALEELVRQREPYWSFLQPHHFRSFLALADLYETFERDIDLVGLARRLLRRLPAESVHRPRLAEAEMLGLYRLGLSDEAEQLALEWCRAADLEGPSAQGWEVLARLHLAANRLEEALWASLVPIAFTTYRSPRGIEACYAVAIAAHHQGGRPAEAEALFRELRAARLPWPSGPEWAPLWAEYSSKLEPPLAQADAEPSEEPAPDLLATAPAPDLRLSVEAIRKLPR